MKRNVRWVALLAAMMGACSEEENTSPAEGQIEVPIIEGDVARENFCGLYRKIDCAANLGCCSLPAEDEASCEAVAPCPLVEHALVEQGVLRYDARAAGDFLRAGATAASGCGQSAEWRKLSFLEGTRGEGELCSPIQGDSAYLQTCAPGLRCSLQLSEEEEPVGTCVLAEPEPTLLAVGEACGEEGDGCATGRCVEGRCAARLADDASCVADEDCSSDQCVGGACAPAGDLFCGLDELPDPPMNSDYSSPSLLCITANNTNNSGSGDDVIMQWYYNSKYYKCTITAEIGDGDTECCVPGLQGSSNSQYNNQIRLWTDSGSDGLRITAVKVTAGSSTWEVGTFDDNNLGFEQDCTGCNVWSENCGSCWLDRDGHGDCAHLIFYMDDREVQCSE